MGTKIVISKTPPLKRHGERRRFDLSGLRDDSECGVGFNQRPVGTVKVENIKENTPGYEYCADDSKQPEQKLPAPGGRNAVHVAAFTLPQRTCKGPPLFREEKPIMGFQAIIEKMRVESQKMRL